MAEDAPFPAWGLSVRKQLEFFVHKNANSRKIEFMHLFFAYAGPDQVMTVTSGLASILGMLLIFWHKVVAFCGRIINRFRGTPTEPAELNNTPPKNS